MKKVILFFLISLTAYYSHAQQRKAGSRLQNRPAVQAAGMKVIDASAVPDAVHNTHKQYFPGATVNRWEKHAAVGKRDTLSKYVAVFNVNSVQVRARYTSNGKAISSTQYYGLNNLPGVLKTAASRYEGFTAVGGEEIQIYTREKTFYRLRMRKGAQKLQVYLDDQGNEVTKEKAPAELFEDENPDGN